MSGPLWVIGDVFDQPPPEHDHVAARPRGAARGASKWDGLVPFVPASGWVRVSTDLEMTKRMSGGVTTVLRKRGIVLCRRGHEMYAARAAYAAKSPKKAKS